MAGLSDRSALPGGPWPVGGLSAVATAALTPLCARAAGRLGIVDRPGHLKPQESAVPYLGGMAVTLGMAGAAAVTGNVGALPAPLLAVAVGLADDVRGLPPAVRLVGEAAAGIAVAGTGSRHERVAAAAANMVLANAFNMIDGADGMAGAVTLASAAGFSVLLGGGDRAAAAALAGAAAGFLVYNREPASIYLGDAGSYVIGTCMTQLLLSAWKQGRRTAMAGLLLVGYPLIELSTTILRRWRSGRPLTHGDRDHIYDRVMRSGWSASAAAVAAGVSQAALALVGVGLARRHRHARRPPSGGQPSDSRSIA
jgi:UDP-GlcNAc:undecaprenyl-phosphate GlcNAc-1-phosphate transferase